MAILEDDCDRYGDDDNDDEPVGHGCCYVVADAENDCIPMMKRE
jgi:hypothetical protein